MREVTAVQSRWLHDRWDVHPALPCRIPPLHLIVLEDILLIVLQDIVLFVLVHILHWGI